MVHDYLEVKLLCPRCRLPLEVLQTSDLINEGKIFRVGDVVGKKFRFISVIGACVKCTTATWKMRDGRLEMKGKHFHVTGKVFVDKEGVLTKKTEIISEEFI